MSESRRLNLHGPVLLTIVKVLAWGAVACISVLIAAMGRALLLTKESHAGLP